MPGAFSVRPQILAIAAGPAVTTRECVEASGYLITLIAQIASVDR